MQWNTLKLLVAALLLTAASACGADSPEPPAAPMGDAGTGPSAPAGPPAAPCDRGYDDPVRRAMCGDPAPVITSLVTLQRALGFDPDLGDLGATVVALNSNSASIVARSVSVLNPRLLMLRTRIGAPDPDFVALGFARGEPFVELAVRDANSLELRFYLVRFELECMHAAGGCSLADTITEAIEREWTRVDISSDDDLRNTPLDCLRCHQPAGPDTPKLLRMQELTFPWTHWITNKTQEGAELFEEFKAAHASTERYGGVPIERMVDLAPQALEGLIRDEAYAAQPNEFISALIAQEVAASEHADSPTWNALYLRALTAQAIPVPYRKLRAADPELQARATAAYAAFTAGTAQRSDLLDVRSVLSLDAERSMNIRPREGSSGEQMIVQICGGCHNSRLDQTLSRARFNAERLDALTPVVRQTALARLQLAPTQPGAMPPPIAAYLSEEERAAITAVFQR